MERTRGSERDRCADAADVISYSTVLIEQVDLNRNLLAEREFAALSEGGSERAALYDEHEWLWNMDQVARDISLSRRRHSQTDSGS